MSGECHECGEHALECVCARCKIDKAANRNLGCDPSGTEIKDFYVKPMESIPIKNYDWIDVTKELPPSDGMYDITNNPNSWKAEDCLLYDGIGFLLVHAYRTVKFWRHHTPLVKRYGKIE